MVSSIKPIQIVTILFLSLIICGCKNENPLPELGGTNVSNSYQENHRPQFHFTPEANWMNDPNGMFFYKGKYHLFYQYFPDSTVWGPMHWGHAESNDMVHWNHLPIGLYPDSIGCIFSGGAVVDVNNSSKLGTDQNPPIVATFTHHDFVGEKAKSNDFQKQSIAYSLDGGLKWTKYKGNPVIPNTEKIKDFRDPKVVWHEASQKWILVLAAYDRAKFYSSSNLIDWEFISDFGIEGDERLWECPDLFPMKVEGSDEKKWVLIVSIQKDAPNDGTATSYFVGDFDGINFKSDINQQKWLDWGTDNYAFVTWNNVKDRVVGIGWMSNWQYAQIVPTETWRSSMTVPRELKLKKSDTGYLLHTLPVDELKKLRGKSIALGKTTITGEKKLAASASQSELELLVDFTETSAHTFGIKLQNDLGENLIVNFNIEAGEMYVDRTNSGKDKFSEEFYKKIHSAPINFEKEELDIRILIDAASIEIFVDKGAMNFTSIFFPTEEFNQISLFSKGGNLEVIDANIYPLKGIWN